MNFLFETNGKLKILGVPILKHLRAMHVSKFCLAKKNHIDVSFNQSLYHMMSLFFSGYCCVYNLYDDMLNNILAHTKIHFTVLCNM